MVIPFLFRLMGLKNALGLAAGLVVVLLVLALYAISGAIGFGVAATVIAGAAYLLGIVSMATAQAVWLGILAVGAVLGVLIGILQLAIVSG